MSRRRIGSSLGAHCGHSRGVQRRVPLVARLGRASPLLERPLDEAAAEEPERGAVAVRAAQLVVVDDEWLGDRLGHLLQPGALPLGRAERRVELAARLLEPLALLVRLAPRAWLAATASPAISRPTSPRRTRTTISGPDEEARRAHPVRWRS